MYSVISNEWITKFCNTKLELARQAAFNVPILTKQTLNKLAEEFTICPFYLSMEMSRWVDIVVADVNYYFDGTPLLLGLTQEFDWKHVRLDILPEKLSISLEEFSDSYVEFMQRNPDSSLQDSAAQDLA